MDRGHMIVGGFGGYCVKVHIIVNAETPPGQVPFAVTLCGMERPLKDVTHFKVGAKMADVTCRRCRMKS